jgi:hypothetical protein
LTDGQIDFNRRPAEMRERINRIEEKSIKSMNEGNNEKESTKQTMKKHYFVSCSPEISPVVVNSFFKLILMFIGSRTTAKQGSLLRP